MKTNVLIQESSPYLLQHAHNPVDWLPWGNQALEKAKKEDKPLLISIGYSSCHWCHVMAHESFEDEATATLMNNNFVCVKVDREERPDIDQLYMNAIQLMSGRGGWPLNCFALPDGRPFYAGTYFQRNKWQDVLRQIANLYRDEREKVEEYALSLSNGIQKMDSLKAEPENQEIITPVKMEMAVEEWMRRADVSEGGFGNAPKFALPNNLVFLLRYGWKKEDKNILNHVHLTLKKMAYGGIYDHIGGGFARYSTDSYWKVPHFEKMLYDNAQLISLYAEAWQQSQNPLYKEICEETAGFISRELYDESGWFFSALDADSEGIEGLYYTWDKEELQEVLAPEDYRIYRIYYNLNEYGYWEDDRYIPLKRKSNGEIALDLGITEYKLKKKIALIKTRLLKIRERRTRPGLDNKLIVSWNGLAIKAYSDLYRIIGDEKYLKTAEKVALFILKNLQDENQRLKHTPNVHGFLEDYSMMADACIALYQACFDESWLFAAKNICETALIDFNNENSVLLWFSAEREDLPISRLKEVNDNVIPASNSVMAWNLYRLGIWFGKPDWIERSAQMLDKVSADLLSYPSASSNWAMLALYRIFPSFELAVSGPEALQRISEISRKYMPDVLFSASSLDSKLPFHEGRSGTTTQYYICREQSCLRPVSSIAEAIEILQENRKISPD